MSQRQGNLRGLLIVVTLVAVTLAAAHGCASPPRAVTAPAQLAPAQPARATACAPEDAAAAQAIRDMYAALTRDDGEALSRLFAPDFYAFDVGKRFTGPELVALIHSLHAAGKTFVWNVVDPQPHVACDMAWVTWENRGAIGDASGTREVTWLESAVLRWTDGAWRIVFFHSTRVPPPS